MMLFGQLLQEPGRLLALAEGDGAGAATAGVLASETG
jgi:hypothetical protein